MPKHRAKAGNGKSAVSARRKLFKDAYMANGRNATQAAISAGFSAKTAGAAGARLLKHVKVSGELAAAAQTVSEMSGLTVVRTLKELQRVSEVDPRRFYRDDGTMKPPGEWDDDMAAAVSSVEAIPVILVAATEDAPAQIGHNYKIKFWDKNAGLEKSMKHLGLFEKDNSQTRESLTLTVEAARPVKR